MIRTPMTERWSKGLGGIDSCNERSTKLFLILATIPLFLVVSILPVVQNRLHPLPSNELGPLLPSATSDIYQYGSRIVKALSFNPSPIPIEDGASSCKQVKNRKEDCEIFSIRVIGERHSGAPWLIRQFSSLVPDIPVGGGLVRGKNWFQTEENLKKVIWRRHHLNSEKVEDLLENVLVVVVTRSPYEWLLAMQKKPYRAPNHIIRDWHKFVTKPWTIPTVPKDKLISQTKGAWCQMNFVAGEVTPCRTNALFHHQASTKKYPVYEHHPITHKPFRNILELRRAKMVNFLNLTKWLPNVKFVSIESLVKNGINKFLDELHEEFGVGICHSEFQDRSFELQITTDMLSNRADEMKYLTCKLDWRVEKQLGYTAMDRFLVNKKTKKKDKCKDTLAALGI